MNELDRNMLRAEIISKLHIAISNEINLYLRMIDRNEGVCEALSMSDGSDEWFNEVTSDLESEYDSLEDLENLNPSEDIVVLYSKERCCYYFTICDNNASIYDERFARQLREIIYLLDIERGYTWDEIYYRAINAAYLSPELNAKDEARNTLREIILKSEGKDIEESESAEEEIKAFLENKDTIYFTKEGYIL